jgi:calpain-7
MQNFESIFLNWDPRIFNYREDTHFVWHIEAGDDGSGSVAHNPQFAVTVREKDDVWILLSRSFRDNRDKASQISDAFNDGTINPHTLTENGDPLKAYTGLAVYSANGDMVYLAEGDVERTPLVTSPQVLLRWRTTAAGIYTIVLSHTDLPPSSYNFTLSVFSGKDVQIDPVKPKYRCNVSIDGSWDTQTSGGNVQNPDYYDNPQFSIAVPASTPLALLIETPSTSKEIPIHLSLVHSCGRRVSMLKSQDVITHTGTYQNRYAFTTLSNIQAGQYTLIASTFEKGQHAKFSIRIDSDYEIKVSPLPRDGAGLISVKFPSIVLGYRMMRIATILRPKRLVRLYLVANFQKLRSFHSIDRTSSSVVHSPFRISLELGRGPERKIILESCEGEWSTGDRVRTSAVDIGPDTAHLAGKEEMYLVFERLTAVDGDQRGGEELFEICAWCDAPDALAWGQWRNWE